MLGVQIGSSWQSSRKSPAFRGELAGFSRTAPVLLVELEAKGHELAVFNGYLDSVNAFSVLTAEWRASRYMIRR